MKIKYNTKFEVGDTVYIAETYYGEYYVSEPLTVQRIHINVDRLGLHIEYELKYKDETFKHFYNIDMLEKQCFPDREECRLWCAMQNKNLRI